MNLSQCIAGFAKRLVRDGLVANILDLVTKQKTANSERSSMERDALWV